MVINEVLHLLDTERDGVRAMLRAVGRDPGAEGDDGEGPR